MVELNFHRGRPDALLNLTKVYDADEIDKAYRRVRGFAARCGRIATWPPPPAVIAEYDNPALRGFRGFM